MLTVLIVILILILIGALPTWPYMTKRNWGYRPSGAIGAVLIIILVLLLLGWT